MQFLSKSNNYSNKSSKKDTDQLAKDQTKKISLLNITKLIIQNKQDNQEVKHISQT
jgi:hypothetical protein